MSGEISFRLATAGKKGGPINPSKRRATVQPLTSLDGCTLKQYAEAKRLKPNFLRALGIRDRTLDGKPALAMPYYDEHGEELAIRYRVALTKTATDHRFQWRRGDRAIPYGLWRLDKAKKAGWVVVVEGESDTHTLWSHGIPALGIPGATTWKESWAEHFLDIKTIYVVVEPDHGVRR